MIFFHSIDHRIVDWRMTTSHFIHQRAIEWKCFLFISSIKDRSIEEWFLFLSSIKEWFLTIHYICQRISYWRKIYIHSIDLKKIEWRKFSVHSTIKEWSIAKKKHIFFQWSKNDRLKNVFYPISNERKIDWEMISTQFIVKKRSIQEWLVFISSIKEWFPTIHYIDQRITDSRKIHTHFIDQRSIKWRIFPNSFNKQRMIDWWMISTPFIDQRATSLKIIPYHFTYQKR